MLTMNSKIHFPIFTFNLFSTFLENVSITFIDKTDPSDPEKRENLGSQDSRPWYLGVYMFEKWWLIEP